jgi:SAM-dependent methyltransferase
MQSPSELREHYEIERELSDRLREARSRAERRGLYGDIYRELGERVAHHPLVVQADDAAGQAAAGTSQVRLLRPFLTPQSVFCEIGAGDATVARTLAPMVRSSIAFDVTDAYLRGPNPDGGFEFRVFDGFDPGLPPACVDLAYSRDLVEHLHPDDLYEQTTAIARMLKPGGMYICVTPNRLSGPHDISRHFDDTPKGFHLREYTSAELASALREAGFSDVRVLLSIDGRRISPLLPAWTATWPEALIAHLPRRVRRRVGRLLAAVKVVGIR